MGEEAGWGCCVSAVGSGIADGITLVIITIPLSCPKARVKSWDKGIPLRDCAGTAKPKKIGAFPSHTRAGIKGSQKQSWEPTTWSERLAWQRKGQYRPRATSQHWVTGGRSGSESSAKRRHGSGKQRNRRVWRVPDRPRRDQLTTARSGAAVAPPSVPRFRFLSRKLGLLSSCGINRRVRVCTGERANPRSPVTSSLQKIVSGFS